MPTFNSTREGRFLGGKYGPHDCQLGSMSESVSRARLTNFPHKYLPNSFFNIYFIFFFFFLRTNTNGRRSLRIFCIVLLRLLFHSVNKLEKRKSIGKREREREREEGGGVEAKKPRVFPG